MLKLHFRLINLIGVIVPRRLRSDWQQEWEAELCSREQLLAEWDRLDWRSKLDLLRRSIGAFWDALVLQPRRLEDEVFQDLRFGMRLLTKSPAFTLVAVGSLALGIGGNAAIFGLLNDVVLRPLPVEDPHQLVTLSARAGQSVRVKFTYPDFADYRNGNEVFGELVSYAQVALSLNDGSRAERIEGLIVSRNYFSALGVKPELGRAFLPEEERTPGVHAVAVLSYGLWQRNFGGDPAVVGRTINLNGRDFMVVGVAPAVFTGTIRGFVPDIYIPMMMVDHIVPAGIPIAQRTKSSLENRNYYWLLLLGRLKPGVTAEQAEAGMTTIAAPIARLHPQPDGSPRPEPQFTLDDGSQGHNYLAAGLAFPLKILMAIVALVLLIACANVANLLLGRAAARRKEVAIRLAIGARRGRLIRQLLTEGLLISLLGGAAGLVLAIWFKDLLLTFAPVNFTLQNGANLDPYVVTFTGLISVLTGLLFGLAPAFAASRPDLVSDLKGWNRVRSRPSRFSLRGGLVIGQVTLSVLVLIGAGLCVRSLQKLEAIDPGFDPEKVLAVSVNLGLQGYTEARGREFYEQLLERVSKREGVESASIAHITPLGDPLLVRTTAVEGYEPQPDENMQFAYNVIGPEYFRTMRIPVLQGREFTDQDSATAPKVVIVNETIARRYWPDESAVGKRLTFGAYRGSPIPLQHLEIVGVVKDNKYSSLTEPSRRMMFLPLAQNYRAEMALHVRTKQEPANLVSEIRRDAQSLDPQMPLFNVKTLTEQKSRSISTSRMASWLLSLFGFVALVLASIGIYGVMAFVVEQRRREIAIRLALGAQASSVFRLVIRDGMWLVSIGLVIGLGGAIAGTHLLDRLLYEVEPTDPVTFFAIAMLLLAVAFLANYLPARRAARTDPLGVLRSE